jgi:hypothetical protein
VEGHWPKGALLYMTKIKRFYVVHEPNENVLKYGASIYNVGNGLYRVFIKSAKMALSFQQKKAFIQEILFSFFKWGTLAQKKGYFCHF